MEGITATRVSTGEKVEIVVDETGSLCARTPDGTVLQARAVETSRLTLRGDTLRWRRVEYRVDDPAAARSFVKSVTPPPRRSRTPALLTGLFAAGLVCGAAGALLVQRQVNRVDCTEPQAVVDRSVQEMTDLNETEEQNSSFYAAVIVEQRAVTYTMDSYPTCFSLADRAGAVGLLEGIRGLLAVSSDAG